MARALRINHPGGRYHVTARGNERKAIFRQDEDRFHFLELLAEVGERYGARVHAYVLMDNHYHLLVETPEANLSPTMQWVNVSYGIWFNRRHDRVGHLFQGRFKAVVVEDDAGWQEVARYVHLNPVRVAGLQLNKRQQAASRAGAVSKPEPEIIAERLRVLRQYRWSSYRGYAGYCVPLKWVWTQPLGRSCGGNTEAERRTALRDYTEQAVLQGALEPLWSRLIGGLVLGSQEFVNGLRKRISTNPREQGQFKALNQPPSWSAIVSALEKVRGERWEQWGSRYGDWGRDAALWLGRRKGRLRLAELGRLAGAMDYTAVAQAVSRFNHKLEKDAALKRTVDKLEAQLSNVKM